MLLIHTHISTYTLSRLNINLDIHIDVQCTYISSYFNSKMLRKNHAKFGNPFNGHSRNRQILIRK